MSTATRRSLQVEERLRAPVRSSGKGLARLNGYASSQGNGHGSTPANGHANGANAANGSNGNAAPTVNGNNGNGCHGNGSATARASNGNRSNGNGASRRPVKPRVFVAAENRLLREALTRMLTKNGDIEVVINDAAELSAKPVQHPAHECAQRDDLHAASAPAMAVSPSFHDAEILLLSSKGNLDQDLAAIRRIRSASPELLILLIDVSGDEANFLQCIRAGVRGYLPRDAAAEDVVEAVKGMHAGKAVCPGTLCTALFHYVEQEASCFPSASVHQRLGLTRREQQLTPLVAEGLTNKEIANRFCLSEQTVKNHLYRMKQKVGAEDRLGIVQVCRTQGFMV